MINLYNQDCLEAMKKMDDNSYDLAIVDPPYGLIESGGQTGGNTMKTVMKRAFGNKELENGIPNRQKNILMNCFVYQKSNHLGRKLF